MRTADYHMLAAAKMPEAELLQQVRDLAHQLEWLTYHPHDSRRSEPGFPDLVLVGHGRMLFRELKQERGRLTRDQRHWINALQASGADVDIWRPSDLLSGAIARELRCRQQGLSNHLLRERIAEEICPGPQTEAHQIVDHGTCRTRAERVIRIVRGGDPS